MTMKITLNWLRDYVDIEMAPEALCELLTMSGLEVEGMAAVGHDLHPILVGKIIDFVPHPNADHLFVCQVDVGRERVQVVCGAPNLSRGVLAPIALPGTSLPGGILVKEALIRGIRSSGMLLAEDEMGLTEDHAGVMVLPQDCVPGDPVTRILLPDHVLDISITPNRPDCTCVLGIAREIAAKTGRKITKPETGIREEGPPIDQLTSVTLVDPEGCPRYDAGVIQDIDLGPSPFWMRYRLHLCGLRSISNVVDVTNYVLLELGQPLHAFDYDRLHENRIVVRRAQEGDRFTTLDGQTREMTGEDLMICDGERPVALAGIMGGLNSEIFGGTQNVLIESAYFDPRTIRRTAKRLGLATEASYRFERGIDPEGVSVALRRALSLMKEMAGGRIATGIIDNQPGNFPKHTISFRVAKTNRFLGTTLTKAQMRGYLQALEMDVTEAGHDELSVTPPSFRVDLSREVDLMEEVSRLNGFENIPVTTPGIRPSEEMEPPVLLTHERVRQIMAGLGFSEIITYSFVAAEDVDKLGLDPGSRQRSMVELLNPLVVDQAVLRTSLLPGLFAAVRGNMAHGERSLGLYEWGRVFIRQGGDRQPSEEIRLAGVMLGPWPQKTWYAEERDADFYDIKGSVETLLSGLGLEGLRFEKGSASSPYHQPVSADIFCGEFKLGLVGQVAQPVMEVFEIEGVMGYIFELDVEAMLPLVMRLPHFEPITRFPAVYRDISVVVRREVENAKIERIIREHGAGLVESVHLFDLYEGEKMGPLEKAMAYRICYRSKERTLDGAEVNRLQDAIVKRIGEETGGRLREA
jgi:phenylalanyl-tRNA synthetase beta chain